VERKPIDARKWIVGYRCPQVFFMEKKTPASGTGTNRHPQVERKEKERKPHKERKRKERGFRGKEGEGKP